MTVLTADVLRPSPVRTRLARYWRGLDVESIAQVVCRDLNVPGTVLPLTQIDGRTVVPIVRIHTDFVARRRRLGQGPVLDRVRLRDLALAGCVDAPPSAVTMQGFLTIDPFPAVRPILGGFAGWARVIAALPLWTRLPAVQAVACDYYGYTVVATDLDTAQVVVAGHPGAAPGSATQRNPWRLLREEQLFDLAITGGQIVW